ncbi:MAG: hypothetical protein NHB15_16095 [Methanosarcina barkeri]|nr:hypothetical protein [Methanosarcina sp. ERenArc_MAG2]
MLKKSSKYDTYFVKENMMGPLDCGRGITSIVLAKEYDVNVFATDLWIGATENYERIKSLSEKCCDLLYLYN